jgi:hypothetical protein
MSKARDLARLSPNASGLLPNANIEAVAASKLTGQVQIANAPSGNVIQAVSSGFATSSDHTSTSFQNTNVTLAITTTIANSRILFLGSLGVNASPYIRCQLTRNGTVVHLAGRTSSGGAGASGDTEHWASLNYLDSPGVSAGTTLTYMIQTRSESGALVRINDNSESTIVILELRP